MTAVALREHRGPILLSRQTRRSVGQRGSDRPGALSAATIEYLEVADEALPAFGAFREPEWMPKVGARLQELLELREDWDGHGGKTIDLATAFFAIDFLMQELDPSTPAPWLVPLSYGGLQAEWHEKDIDLEIEFMRPNRVYAFCQDHRGDQAPLDAEYETDFSALAEPINELTNR